MKMKNRNRGSANGDFVLTAGFLASVFGATVLRTTLASAFFVMRRMKTIAVATVIPKHAQLTALKPVSAHAPPLCFASKGGRTHADIGPLPTIARFLTA